MVLFDEYGPVRMIRTAHWKYVHRHAHGPHELFDLVNDPGERLNLAADPDRAELIQQLRGRIDEWFAQYVEGRRDGLLQNGMVHGQERFVDR